jgi:subtilisin family serine protease
LFITTLYAQPQSGSSEPVEGIVLVKFSPEALPTLKPRILATDLPEVASRTMGSRPSLRQVLPFGEGRKVFSNFTPADTLARHRDTGEQVRLLDLSRWYTVTVPDTTGILALVERLKKHPLVEAAAPEYPLRPSVVTPNDDEFQNGEQWNLDNPTYDADIDAPEAWSLNQGRSDVTVAILDGGVDYNHPDLDPGDRSRVIQGYDVADNDGDAMDDIPSGKGFADHGTLVAGVAGAITDNNRDIAGVMWNTQIMPVKVAFTNGPWWDRFGWTQGSAFRTNSAQGVNYARNNGADVINMSFGSPDYPGNGERAFVGNPLGEAAYNAYLQGLVVVASSGNDNQDQVGFPAISAGVISVGNTTITDARNSSSNYGPNLDLVAPGTAYPSTKRGGGVDQSVTGTSFSAPMVAGVAGLILSESRDRSLGLTNDDIQHLMEQTADDLGSSGRDDEFGHGRVNARKALEALQPPNEVEQVVHTGGAGQKIDDDFSQIFIYNGRPDGIASGSYFADVYEVNGSVTFDHYYEQPPMVWIRDRSTKGWSINNPNNEMPYVKITNVTNEGFDFRTYAYYVTVDKSSGQQINSWYPASPSGVKIAYTAVGDRGTAPTPPPSVSLTGPYSLSYNESGTWTADVTDGVAPFTYRWRTRPASDPYGWTTQKTTTTSNRSDSYSHAMGLSGFVVEARVTDDRGEAETKTINVAYDSGGGGCPPGEECENLRRADPVPPVVLPDTAALAGSYPNPAREAATIRVALPEARAVTLTVYDVQGRVVKRLADGTLPAGFHDVALDVSGLSSGVYLYRLTAGAFTETKRLVVVK